MFAFSEHKKNKRADDIAKARQIQAENLLQAQLKISQVERGDKGEKEDRRGADGGGGGEPLVRNGAQVTDLNQIRELQSKVKS